MDLRPTVVKNLHYRNIISSQRSHIHDTTPKKDTKSADCTCQDGFPMTLTKNQGDISGRFGSLEGAFVVCPPPLTSVIVGESVCLLSVGPEVCPWLPPDGGGRGGGLHSSYLHVAKHQVWATTDRAQLPGLLSCRGRMCLLHHSVRGVKSGATESLHGSCGFLIRL